MVRDREIIDALVDPAHRGPSPELKRLLDGWPGYHYWVPQDGPGRIVLVRALGRPQRERWWLHVALFLATFVTVAAGGALLGVDPVRPTDAGGSGAWPVALWGWLRALRPGLEFATALMAILLTHECGHYFVARRYGINASPPYFLPAPWFWNFVGTFGAFIRLRSPIADRRQLMDVGAAGPWAGFVVAVLFLGIGLTRSHVFPAPPDRWPFIVFFQGTAIPLGDSIVTYLARHWLVGEGTVQLHPLAMAGWVGVFVTTLNLLPLGQLDGGHVLYALLGDRQRIIGRIMWLALIPLGAWFIGWWFWAALILLFSRGRVSHPAVLDRHRTIPASRWWLGWATVVLFAITFMPTPFHAPFHM